MNSIVAGLWKAVAVARLQTTRNARPFVRTFCSEPAEPKEIYDPEDSRLDDPDRPPEESLACMPAWHGALVHHWKVRGHRLVSSLPKYPGVDVFSFCRYFPE